MRERLTVTVVRGIFLLICAGIGVLLSQRFGGDENPGAWIAVPLSVLVGGIIVVIEVLFSRASVQTISAIVFGLLVGFAAAALFSPVIDVIVERIELGSTSNGQITDAERAQVKFILLLVATTLFCYFGVTVLLQTRDQFRFLIPYVEFRPEVKGLRPLLVDSSVILEGNLGRLAASGFFESRLVVPGFVAAEIQQLADSGDRRRRVLGERGLQMLKDLVSHRHVEILHYESLAELPVDEALLRAARQEVGRILTRDQKLAQRAELERAPVIFLPAVIEALQPRHGTGDRFTVELVRAGEEEGQGVGYLEDGTMVVVDDGAGALGSNVEVEVRRVVPTATGRILFTRRSESAQ